MVVGSNWILFVFFPRRKREKRKRPVRKRLPKMTPQVMRSRMIPRVKKTRQKKKISLILADLRRRKKKRPNKRALPPVSTSWSV